MNLNLYGKKKRVIFVMLLALLFLFPAKSFSQIACTSNLTCTFNLGGGATCCENTFSGEGICCASGETCSPGGSGDDPHCITCDLAYSGTVDMSFGIMKLPDVQDEVILDTDDSTSGTGEVLGGTVGTASGTVDVVITGGGTNHEDCPSDTVSFDISNISSPTSDITLKDLKVVYDTNGGSPQTITSFPATGLDAPDPDAQYTIGATVEYNNNVSETNYNLSFDTIIAYE